MKNFKKVIALVLAFAMLLSTTTVAFAATDVQNTDKANVLHELELFAGTSTTTFDANLAGAANREQAMKILALALSWDVDMTATTTFKDVSPWAVPYVAYAAAHDVTTGMSATEFGAKSPVTAKQLSTWILRALGYPNAWTDLAAAATSAGVIASDDNVVALNRDALVGVVYAALTATPVGQTKSLIATIVGDNASKAAIATAAGLITPVVVVNALTVSAITALNTKQFQVVFNNAVDKTTAETAANYTVAGVAFDKAVLQADAKTVVLTMAAETKVTNATEVEIKVLKNVKDAAGVALASDFAKKLTVVDTTSPAYTKVEAVGAKTIKVTFSEPVMDASGDTGIELDQITVKSGIYNYSVTAAVADYAANTITLTLGTNLIEGTVTVKLNAQGMSDTNAIRDFAGLVVVPVEVSYVFAKDTTVATATLTSVNKATGVAKVTFSKPVYGTSVKLYHSVNGTAAYGTAGVTKSEANAATEWEFTFTNALPSGALTFYLANDSVTANQLTDLFGVKVPNNTFVYTVVADTVAPTVSEVKINTNVSFDVVYSEDVDATEKVKAANYEILKADGTKLAFTVSSVDAKTAKLSATLEDNATYTVNVKAMKDVAGNALAATYSVQKTIADNSNPTVTDQYLVGADTIYLVFSEAMSSASISNKANYLVAKSTALSTFVALGDNDKVELISNKKVKITFAAAGLVAGQADVKIAMVTDAAGKRLVSDTTFATDVLNIASSTVAIDKAELVAVNKVKITFTKALGAFDSSEFSIRQTDNGATDKVYAFQSIESNVVNSDGKTEIVLVLDNSLSTDAKDKSGAPEAVEVVIAGATVNTKSTEGTVITAAQEVTVADKVAPSISTIAFNGATQIIVTFDEVLNPLTVAGAGANGFTVGGGTLTSALIGATNNVVVLTGTDFTVNTDVTYTAGNIKDANANALATVAKTDALAQLVATQAATPNTTATLALSVIDEVYTAATPTGDFLTAGGVGVTVGDFKFVATGTALAGEADDNLVATITTGGLLTFAFTDTTTNTGAVVATITITHVPTGAVETVTVTIAADDSLVVTE